MKGFIPMKFLQYCCIVSIITASGSLLHGMSSQTMHKVHSDGHLAKWQKYVDFKMVRNSESAIDKHLVKNNKETVYAFYAIKDISQEMDVSVRLPDMEWEQKPLTPQIFGLGPVRGKDSDKNLIITDISNEPRNVLMIARKHKLLIKPLRDIKKGERLTGFRILMNK